MPTPQELMEKVNTLVGAGAVKLGSSGDLAVRVLPTGVAPIDYLLRGGLPRGRMTEIYGDFSTLKTYIALRAIAATQSMGGVVALIDTEHSYDPEWAKSNGVDTGNLILQQPPNGETAIDTMEVLIRGKADLVVVDSIASLLPAAEEKTKLSDKNVQPARLAALMSTALRKLTSANTGATALLWINQTRNTVGVTFGNREVVSGGRAMGFYASWRINIKRAGNQNKEIKIWDGEKFATGREVLAFKLRARVDKSKLDRPFREVFFDYNLSQARIDELGFLVSLAMDAGLVAKKGPMWTLVGHTPVRGREVFYRSLDAEALKNLLGLPGAPGPPNNGGWTKKPARSGSGAGGSTPGRVRAASNGTAVRKMKSSKSSLHEMDLFLD